MRRFAFLFGTVLLLGAAPAFAQSSSVTVGPNGSLSSTTRMPGSTDTHSSNHSTNLRTGDEPCRVIGSDGRNSDGALSSTVTAGPNGVHSYSSGGPSVTVRSKDGRSVSSSSASSSSDGTTVITGSGGSGGDCTIVTPDSDHTSTESEHR